MWFVQLRVKESLNLYQQNGKGRGEGGVSPKRRSPIYRCRERYKRVLGQVVGTKGRTLTRVDRYGKRRGTSTMGLYTRYEVVRTAWFGRVYEVVTE